MSRQVLNLRNKRSLTTLVASLLLGLLCVPVVGLADDDTAPPSGRSSGGRGCGTSTMTTKAGVPALILLTPNGKTGQTVSTHPTFAWFVRDAEPFPVEFRLYAETGGIASPQTQRFTLLKEIKGDRLRSSPGIMVLSPAESLPALTVGKRYRWQVELICNPSRPSSNLFAESVIEIVPLPPALKTQLEKTHDRGEKAKLYAQADLWYDVLRTAFVAPGETTNLQTLRVSLLNTVTIDASERKLLQASPIHTIQP